MTLSEKPHVLVTGAAGFIGGYVVREFVENNWAVKALVHRRISGALSDLVQQGKVIVIKGDVTDRESVENMVREAKQQWGRGPDVVVHCAGRASDVGWKREFRKTNFDSVRYLGEKVLAGETGRLVFISTTDVYGLRDFKHEQEENLSLCNNKGNPYPEYKIRAEQWITAHLKPEQYAIIRPAAVWGSGDTTMTARVVDFLRISPWIVHFGSWKGKNRWPMAHVRNVAAGIFLAATRPELEGKAVHVLDNEFTSCDEFYECMAKIFFPGRKYSRLFVPMWPARLFGAAVSAISSFLNLDHPIMDPSLYALHIVSSNLDFNNRLFAQLMEKTGRHVWTREEGLAELKGNFRQD